MFAKLRFFFQAALPGLLVVALPATALGDWSGNIATELLAFQKQPLSSSQHNNYLSVSAEAIYQQSWDNGHQWFDFRGFVRGDQYDSRRSHVDIREFSLGYASERWELIAGISKVYWGVTESQHLVDIINQTDFVENLDTEDKLGQPMINLAYVADYGTLNMYLLPGFRERVFPGKAGRPRFSLTIEQDNEQYDDNIKYRNLDFALRWFQTLGDWEIGLSHFSGTSRTPFFELTHFPAPCRYHQPDRFC